MSDLIIREEHRQILINIFNWCTDLHWCEFDTVKDYEMLENTFYNYFENNDSEIGSYVGRIIYEDITERYDESLLAGFAESYRKYAA